MGTTLGSELLAAAAHAEDIGDQTLAARLRARASHVRKIQEDFAKPPLQPFVRAAVNLIDQLTGDIPAPAEGTPKGGDDEPSGDR